MDNFILKNPQNLVHQMCRETAERKTTATSLSSAPASCSKQRLWQYFLVSWPRSQNVPNTTRQQKDGQIFPGILEQQTFNKVTFALQRTLPSPPISPHGKCHQCHKARVSSSSQPCTGMRAAHPKDPARGHGRLQLITFTLLCTMHTCVSRPYAKPEAFS